MTSLPHTHPSIISILPARSLAPSRPIRSFFAGLLFVVANHEKTGNMGVLAAYVTGLIVVHALILVLLTVRAVRAPAMHHVPIP